MPKDGRDQLIEALQSEVQFLRSWISRGLTGSAATSLIQSPISAKRPKNNGGWPAGKPRKPGKKKGETKEAYAARVAAYEKRMTEWQGK